MNRSIARPGQPGASAADECGSSSDMKALATSSKPDILSIREGWSLWLLNGLLFLIPLAVLSEIIAPTLPSRAILFSVGGIVVGRLRRAAAFALIGDTGVLWWSLRRLGRAGLQSVEWKDIEGCSRKNEDRLHILRIFPRQIHATGRCSSPVQVSRSRSGLMSGFGHGRAD